MSKSCKQFSLSATIKNISRFVDGETYYTDTEERFNIPWRMFIRKNDIGFFALGLICEKNNWENREWSIETEYVLKLVSYNGNTEEEDSEEFTFDNSDKSNYCLMTSWDELESDYVVNDSIVVEAYVKIFRITDFPCDEDEDTKTFLLSKTVKDISSIEEGDDYYTETTIRHNIPWTLQIERNNGFFGLFLRCEKEEYDELGRTWSIELDYDLRLVSLNGQSLTFSDSCSFEDPWREGSDQFMRWDDMEDKYMVNDSIIIEARVRITEMTGFDDDSSSEEDESSSDDEEYESSSDE